jgi:hypothetical protein
VTYYRDNATALAQRAPGNFIGVALYVPLGGGSTAPWWAAVALSSAKALEEWYDEIAGAPTLYYYLAAFDKTRALLPVGESIAPPKPGMPGFNLTVTDRWRHPLFNKATDRPAVSGETAAPSEGRGGLAKTVALFALFAIPAGILLSKRQDLKQLRAEKAEFRRLGWDWNRRAQR